MVKPFPLLLPMVLAVLPSSKKGNTITHARITLFFRFDMIFFTGGPRIGKFVMKAAAEYLTPVVLELGGKNPVWVDPSADLHRTARSIIWAKTTNTGKPRLSSPDTELDSVGLTMLIP